MMILILEFDFFFFYYWFQVGIPILMAKILTFPERVSNHNIERLRHAVRNGTIKYPGAKHIRKTDGSML